MISKKIAGCVALAACLLAGCGNNQQASIPDISGVKVDLQTYRFDKDLYAMDTAHLGEGLSRLKSKYPDFLDYYLDTIREYNIHGNYSDTVKGIREDLKIDLTYKDFKDLQDTIMKYYPDSKETDQALTEGFRFMKHYFPSYPVPRIIYLDMGLSKWPSFPVDNGTLCIGLDMFLGDQFPHYKSVGLTDYTASHRRKAYLPVSVFSTVYRTSHPWKPDDKPLLQLMIERGKEQYFLHKVLPHLPDSVLFGFSKQQLEWCSANEAVIYNFFIRQNLLYSKEGHSIYPYVSDGPFAKGFEAADAPVKYSPGNIGTWMGYRIVSEWMALHPNETLEQLTNTQHESARFLSDAKYKPK